MFVAGDFIWKSKKIEVLGEGTFGSVSLRQTPVGKYVIKETKISDESLGYPHDFINEVDMLIKLRQLPTVVTLQGVFFDEEKKKGYIMMDACDTNLSHWAKQTPFEERIGYLGSLLEMMGSTLSIMHRFGLIHNDIKSNNILVNLTSTGPFFKLADFGKSKCIIENTGSYGCIERYKAPYNLDLFGCEFWAFMVVLVEVILGGKRMLGDRSFDDFYQKHLRLKNNGSIHFDLDKYLRHYLPDRQFEMIPKYFWDFIELLITHQKTDIESSLKRIGVHPREQAIKEVNNSISRDSSVHSLFTIVEPEFKKRLRVLDLSKHFDRFSALFNKFLHLAGIQFNELDLKRYAEVAFVMIARRKSDHLKHFHDQDTFLLYQRAFFTTMGYQVHVLS